MIYFKKIFEKNNNYTAEDFLNETEVVKMYSSARNNETDYPPVFVRVCLQYYRKLEDETNYDLTEKSFYLTISTIFNTNKIKERMYTRESFENHIKALFEYIKPGDKLSMIEMSNGAKESPTDEAKELAAW